MPSNYKEWAESLLYPDHLEHYGVLGMKWGVRKDPKQAVSRANEKLKTIDNRVTKLRAKSSKKYQKALERNASAESAFFFRGFKKWRASGASRKAARSLSKVQANTLKAKRWAENMDKVFSQAKVTNPDKESLAIAKKYADMTLEAIAANQVTINALLNSRERYRTNANFQFR